MIRSMRTAAGFLLLWWALACPAQDYPSKPILFLMPLQAGSAVDVMVRIVAQKMGDNLGRQIVVENQPGAAGMIGAERVKRAAPDGYSRRAERQHPHHDPERARLSIR
jgi:tripartite-type tricarboxylate transporter receptor subunit TctC